MLQNDQSPDQLKKVNKILYKNQKRKTRNRLIYLVGLHVFFIFCFAAFLCAEYLIPQNNGSRNLLSIISDSLYAFYSFMVLFSIKFKNRKLLITSILTLALSIGFKLVVFVSDTENILILGGFIFLLCNCAIPWALLLLWNKLKENKWRQTFDLHTKLTSHLNIQ